MARAGLTTHRKFQRLARLLDGVLPGMGATLARGALETMWEVCYEQADDYLGDADDVEIAAGWRGERGLLCRALLDAGGAVAAGFIEQDPERAGLRVHDLWQHAPPYVKRKAADAAKRAAEGRSVSDARREAGRKGHAASLFARTGKQQTEGTTDPAAGKTSTENPANERPRDRQTVDHLPSSERQTCDQGRVGSGRVGSMESLPAFPGAREAGAREGQPGGYGIADLRDDWERVVHLPPGDGPSLRALLALVERHAALRGQAPAAFAAHVLPSVRPVIDGWGKSGGKAFTPSAALVADEKRDGKTFGEVVNHADANAPAPAEERKPWVSPNAAIIAHAEEMRRTASPPPAKRPSQMLAEELAAAAKESA
jgi:hypothetical protein